MISELPGLLLPLDGWGRFHAGARPAAVVAVLYERDSTWHLPFVLRRPDLLHHPGQVALPGGGVLPGEESWMAAAREVEEEIGVPARDLQPLGAGPVVHAAISNYSVVPFVAWLPNPPAGFTHDPGELAGVLEVPLDRLLDPSAWVDLDHPRFRRSFPWGEAVIWGLTGRILEHLLPHFAACLDPNL